MKNEVRAAIAYVAGRLISGKPSSSIYSFVGHSYTALGGSVSPSSVNVFDSTGNCCVTGGGDGQTLKLFHSAVQNYISLTIQDDRFTGFDYASGAPFEGVARRFRILVYDAQEQKTFSYML